MGVSERHHYIPEFLIKGFTGKDGKVSVFDLKKGKIKSGRKSPKQIFYEWNRNTFKIENQSTDFVEKLYQFGENRFAPVYNKIVEQKGPINLTENDWFHLIYFIGTLHWRLPYYDKEVEEIIDNSTNEDFFFTIRDKETGEEVSSGIYEHIMSEPAFIESQKIMLAVLDYLKTDVVEDFENWKMYYADGDVRLHLLGDNPIIYQKSDIKNPYQSELIFRLSKGKSIYHTNGKKVKKLSPEHAVSVDLLVFLQSEKMVCSPNKNYLKHLSQLAKQYDSTKKINYLRNQVFDVFE